jgi:hypothetical protein
MKRDSQFKGRHVSPDWLRLAEDDRRFIGNGGKMTKLTSQCNVCQSQLKSLILIFIHKSFQMAKLYEHTYQRLEYSVNQQLPYSDSFCTI